MRNRVGRARPRLPRDLPQRRRVCRKGEPETMVEGVMVNRGGWVTVTDFGSGAILLCGYRSDLSIFKHA